MTSFPLGQRASCSCDSVAMSALGVVVVGSCNIDQIAYAPKLPRPGETVHGTKYETGYGGKGANQCVAAAKLGGKAAMIAKVGKDDNGANYISHLKNVGVNVEHVTVSEDSCTGVAPITVDSHGSNCIVVVPGANMMLSCGDVDSSKSLIASSKVLLCQLEIQEEVTLHALKTAKSSGTLTIFNPAPSVSYLSPDFYENTDIICVNETEGSMLSGIEVTDLETAFSAGRKISTMGCGVCVVTLGENGSAVVDGSKEYHVPAETVHVIDTTGAGDCFLGSLAYFLSKFGKEFLKEALEKASRIAAFSVTRKGTQSSYPTKSDLPDYMLENIK